MGIFLEKMMPDLRSGDQEILLLSLVKLLVLKVEFLEDPQYYASFRPILRKLYYQPDDELAMLSLQVRLSLDKILEYSLPADSPRREESKQILRNQNSSRKECLGALLSLADHGGSEDLFLVGSYLKSKDPILRCGALEVYLQHLQEEGDLVHLISLVADGHIRVKSLAEQIFIKAGQKMVFHVLAQMASSRSPASRMSVIFALCQIQTSPEVLSLLFQLTADSVEEIKSRATQALAYHPCEETMLKLKSLQNDMSIETCESANRALKAIEQGLLQASLVIPE